MPHPHIDIPADWAEAVRRILAGPARRLAVLGPGDTGKSSFCRVLLHEAERAGRPALLLDADPAQKLVGPPACVTLGLPGPEGEAAAPTRLAFLGSLDPLRGWRPLMEGTARLAREAGPGLLLANTGGFLAGAGRRLKAAKLRALRAELLVAIGTGPALEAVLADHAGIPVLRLLPSPRARRKSAAERRARRQEAFRHHFAGATAWTAPAPTLAPEGLPRAGMPTDRPLLGLADAPGRDIVLGLLLGLDRGAGAVTVLAPAGPGRVARLRPGLLALDAEFRERRLPPPG